MHNNKIVISASSAEACSVCGAPLMECGRELVSIHVKGHYTSSEPLNFHRIMVCPKRIGLGAMFYFRHDRRAFTDTGAEVLLNDDEFTMAV